MKKLIEAINQLKDNAKIPNIINSKNTPNFWDVIEYGVGSYETRYSRMLRWLLDEDENHGLGNKFAREVLAFCEEQLQGHTGVDESKLYEPSAGKSPYPLKKSAQVEALGENIDIFYNKLDPQSNLLVMEVKHLADEHTTIKNGKEMSQLEKYVEAIYKHKKYNFEEYDNKYFVFLTVDGHEAPSIAKDRKNDNLQEWQKLWISMSYADLIDIVGKLLKEETYMNMDTMKLVKDFKNDLERQTFSAEDKSILNDMYSNNKEKITELYNFYFPQDEAGEKDDSKETYEDIIEIERAVNDPMLKEYIRLIYDNAVIQNHTPNEDVSHIIRKMYNQLSGSKEFDLEDYSQSFTPEERRDELKESWKNALGLDNIQLTGGKGQGIYLGKENSPKTHGYRIYFSGDSKGVLPNDDLHVSVEGKKHKTLKITSKEFIDLKGVRYHASDLVGDQLLFQVFFDDYIEKVKTLQEMIKESGEYTNK